MPAFMTIRIITHAFDNKTGDEIPYSRPLHFKGDQIVLRSNFYPEGLRAEAQRQAPPMPTAVEIEPVLPLDAKIDEATGDISWPAPELRLVEPSRSISRGVVPELKVFEPDTDSEIETDSKAGPPTQAVKSEPDIEAISPEPA
jgi:hypothetical protein